MGTYGNELYDVVGSGITVSADGRPKAKAGGVTIAWAAVPALSAAYTFKWNDAALISEKVIRYGTILCRITAATDGTEVGKFMPYMATPGGGRTLGQGLGDAFILNETVHENDRKSDHPTALDGGRMYKRRLLVVGYGDGTETGANAILGATTMSAGAITVIPVTNGGYGYSAANPPVVTITGNGTGATATATVSAAGIVTGIVVTAGGTGYTVSAATVSGGGAGHQYSGDTAENAADLAALGVTAFPAATFVTSFPDVLFVTES
jgi:hypothetical protein